jgi:hypothetical protein
MPQKTKRSAQHAAKNSNITGFLTSKKQDSKSTPPRPKNFYSALEDMEEDDPRVASLPNSDEDRPSSPRVASLPNSDEESPAPLSGKDGTGSSSEDASTEDEGILHIHTAASTTNEAPTSPRVAAEPLATSERPVTPPRRIPIPKNPYKATFGGPRVMKQTGTGPARPSTPQTAPTGQSPAKPKNVGWDFDITLKRGIIRHYTARYDLRFKLKTTTNDDESQVAIHRILTEFVNIILQADDSTIIPPYLNLDRHTNSINDLSSTYLVSELNNFTALKTYFARLYSRPEGGQMYCSVILAGSMASTDLLNAVKYKLSSLDMGLWSRPTDHEQVSDVGWLLYSCRSQDEFRIASMLSEFLNIIIGARWRQIRTSEGQKKKDSAHQENIVRAIHLEGPSHRIHDIKSALSKWYGSSASSFLDGTKMRLIPPFQSVISADDKAKYGAVVARQAAFLSRLATGTSWEFATNLTLDRVHPSTGTTLRGILMSIDSLVYKGKPVFHSIDRTWRSDSQITFTFLPENESDARMYIAGLVPFLRDTQDKWYLKCFTEEAKMRHKSSIWDPKTKQVSSTTDIWVRNALALDDEMNFTDTPTASWAQQPQPQVVIDIPDVSVDDDTPDIYKDQDSISTFHPHKNKDIQTTSDNNSVDPNESDQTTLDQSTHPSPPSSFVTKPKKASKSVKFDNSSISRSDVISRLSDTDTKISLLEHSISTMTTQFEAALSAMQKSSEEQARHSSMLGHIFSKLFPDDTHTPSTPDGGESSTSSMTQANPLPLLNSADGSEGVVGRDS